MGYDGNGNFLRIHSWVADATAGVKIRADRHDAEDDNFANGLSNVITKDGQTQPTANIPMNGYKIIAVGSPTDPGDVATKTYVDARKAFTSDIEVTDEVIFKDGTARRGSIKGTIGSGVAASMVFETNNDAGALVNQMTLDANGLNLRTNGYRLAPSDILRGSLYAETTATPAVYLRGYDTAGVEKALLALTNGSAYLKTSDAAITAYSLQFRQSDNVQRGGIISDFTPTDGATTLFIKNGAGTTRNNLTLNINGATLTTGVFSAPAWTFPAGTVTMSGIVTMPSLTRFEGASGAAGTPVIQVQNKRTTTTSEGQAVFSITRQNSTTDGLIFGNDANHYGLIGSNATPTRLGYWSGGVFTENFRVNTDRTSVFTPLSGTSIIVNSVGLEIAYTSPRIKFTDTTAGAAAFWTYVDGSTFYILVDRNLDGTWETPHPLALNSIANNGQLFGNEIVTAANAINYDSYSARFLRSGGAVGGTLMQFNWSGQGGQPQWIWGGDAGSTGTQMYVYNPSNFNVNHANSAGNADTVDGFHGSDFWKGADALGGNGAGGWVKFPNGLYLNIGSGVVATNGSGDGTLSFPVAFPNACLCVVGCGGDPNVPVTELEISTLTKTTFGFRANGAASQSVRVNWIAWGW